MERITAFCAFLGPIITLLPALFVSSKGEGALDVGFCLITVFALMLCYLFSTQGLIAALIVLATSLYFLNIQLIWTFGVIIALFSGLIVTTFSWSVVKKQLPADESMDAIKANLLQTQANLRQEMQEKNALKQQLFESQTQVKSIVDISPLKKQLEEKVANLNQIKQELFQVKSKFETLKKDQDQSQKDIEEKLAEKEKIIQLFKKQESELLSLLKKEHQLKTPNE